MRKLLLIAVVALAAVALVPERSQAQGFGFGPGRAPYGFLGRLATSHMMWIHSDGPLYNYGPYHVPGHVTMHIPKPYFGTYTPGDYTLWGAGGNAYQGYGYQGYAPQGYGYGYPAAGGPQTIAPPPAVGVPMTSAPAAAPAILPVSVAPPTPQRVSVLPTPYSPIYPNWLTGR